jgi:hypothetical protein
MLKSGKLMIDSHPHAFRQGRNDTGLTVGRDEQGIPPVWLPIGGISPAGDDAAYHRGRKPEPARSDGTHTGISLNRWIQTRNRHPNRFGAGYGPHSLQGDAPAFSETVYRMLGVCVCGE